MKEKTVSEIYREQPFYKTGRPRTNCPDEIELVQLGKELVEWSSEKTDELRCRFCQWYSIKGFVRKTWEQMIQKNEFRIYYDISRMYLGQRLLDGSVNPSMAHRISWHYLPEAKEQEKAKIDYQEEARSRADVKTAQEISVTTINYAGSCQKNNNPTP